MLVLMAFIMILKKVNTWSIKNGIKELSMTIKDFFEAYEIEVEGEFKPFGVTDET